MQRRFDHVREPVGDGTVFDIPALVAEARECFTLAGPPGSGRSTPVDVGNRLGVA